MGSRDVYSWVSRNTSPAPSPRSLAYLPDLLCSVLCTHHTASFSTLLGCFPCLKFSFCLFLTPLALICLPHLFEFIRKQKDTSGM